MCCGGGGVKVARSGKPMTSCCTYQLSGLREGVNDEDFTIVSYCAAYRPVRKLTYRGADKSLARPGRKQADVSVGIA